MEFSWDPYKQEINKKKHGISFTTALLIFRDPCIVSILDDRDSNIDEERWSSIGLVNNTIIYVAHATWENENGKEIIRIISARLATTREQRYYFTHR